MPLCAQPILFIFFSVSIEQENAFNNNNARSSGGSSGEIKRKNEWKKWANTNSGKRRTNCSKENCLFTHTHTTATAATTAAVKAFSFVPFTVQYTRIRRILIHWIWLWYWQFHFKSICFCCFSACHRTDPGRRYSSFCIRLFRCATLSFTIQSGQRVQIQWQTKYTFECWMCVCTHTHSSS